MVFVRGTRATVARRRCRVAFRLSFRPRPRATVTVGTVHGPHGGRSGRSGSAKSLRVAEVPVKSQDTGFVDGPQDLWQPLNALAPPNPPPACLWPGLRPHLASVFKGSSKTRVNIGRPLIRGGTSSAPGAVTGALLYSSRRSSDLHVRRASAIGIAAHRGEPTGKRGNHLFA